MSHTELKEELEYQAEWRREKATAHPNDHRNEAAAEMFDRMAATASSVSEFAMEQLEILLQRDGFFEEWSQMLREVGFQRAHDTADELVIDFITTADPVVRREYRARLTLKKRGLRLERTPARHWSRKHGMEGYQILDDRNVVVAGACQREYELSLDEVEQFVKDGARATA